MCVFLYPMKILLLAPTLFELASLNAKHPSITTRVCGVGGTALAMDVIPFLEKGEYDLGILVGLAGGLPGATSLGQVVKIEHDIQGDLGVFEQGKYYSFEQIGLIEQKEKKTLYNVCDNILPKIATLDALSTNILFDESDKNNLRHKYYETQIENMEGAAFQQICEEYELPYLQLRAVSNFIGERDKKNWKITEALKNLNKTLAPYLKTIV